MITGIYNYEGSFCLWTPGETQAQRDRQAKIDALADWEYDRQRDLAMIEELENPSD